MRAVSTDQRKSFFLRKKEKMGHVFLHVTCVTAKDAHHCAFHMSMVFRSNKFIDLILRVKGMWLWVRTTELLLIETHESIDPAAGSRTAPSASVHCQVT